MGNHAERLTPQPDFVVNYNETGNDLMEYRNDEWNYRANCAPETWPENTVNMWHNMYRAWLKAPEGFDCYVRMRYDIVFDSVIDFTAWPMLPDVVYIPNCSDYRDGVNDQMAFGSYGAMEKYFSVYLNHGKLFDSGLMFHSETYLKHNLEMLGVKIRRIPVTNRIIRTKNEYETR